MRLQRLVLMLLAMVAVLVASMPALAQPPRIVTPTSVQAPAVDGKRIALVIGNSRYQNPTGWSVLENAERDVRYVADQLANLPGEGASFEVTLLIDLGHDEMKAALEEYARRAATADVSLIYYAGHGFQFKGENYLAPVDARPRVAERSLEGVHIKFADVVKAATAKKLTLFFLDACRTTNAITATSDVDNSVNQATYFGAVESDNTAVIYAAGAKLPAYDAVPTGAQPPRSQTSPFAQAVINQLKIPGLELTEFYKFVRGDVKRATSSLSPVQKPIMAAGLDSSFFFLPAVTADTVPLRDLGGDNLMPASAPSGSGDGGPVSDLPTDVGALPILDRLNIPENLLAFEDDEYLVQEVLQQRSLRQLGVLGSQGDPLANYILGTMYFKGIIVDADWDKAWDYFDASAAEGHPAGLFGLAWFAEQLIVDHQVEVDIDLEALYREAHEKGFQRATFRMAEAYADRLIAPPADRPQDDLAIYRQAADLGHARSMYQLTIRKVEDSDFYFEKLFGRANTIGDTHAANWLCLLDDEFLEFRKQLAACLMAAQAGEPMALAKLTTDIINREDTDISREEAQDWATLALGIVEFDMETRARVEAIADGKF